MLCSFVLLLEACPKLCEGILANSCKYFPIYDSALVKAGKILYESLEEWVRSKLVPKEHIHFRVMGMPMCPEVHRSTIPRNQDFGKFLCIQGTVIRTTQARILEYEREYKCTKCGHEFLAKAEYDQYYMIQVPVQCPKSSGNCRSTSFKAVEKNIPVYRKDYQEIKLQEQIQKLAVGTVPKSIWITLEDDLVDQCKPGDDIIVW